MKSILWGAAISVERRGMLRQRIIAPSGSWVTKQHSLVQVLMWWDDNGSGHTESCCFITQPDPKRRLQCLMAGNNDDDDDDDDEVTYRSVEKAFVVHGQVELGLDALDGHHAESHGDQVEHGCTNTHINTRWETCTHTVNTAGKQREKSSSISVSHLLWWHFHFATAELHCKVTQALRLLNSTNELAPATKCGLERVRIIKRHAAKQGMQGFHFQPKTHRVRAISTILEKTFTLQLQIRIAFVWQFDRVLNKRLKQRSTLSAPVN